MPAKKIKKDIVVKTDLTFEELLKKALNTPLPKLHKAVKAFKPDYASKKKK